MFRYPMVQRAFATALLALVALAPVSAHAAGEIIITHAKALAGNIVPGDTPGYPVQLRVSGSYALGSNLDVPVNNTAIQIFADDVTIDLSGYRLFGNAKSAWYGIVGGSGADGATIKNGTIEGFRFDGIVGAGRFWSIEDMRIVINGGYGIRAGDDAHVRSSRSAENGLDGVVCGNACLVERNTATSNGRDGVVCGLSCHAEGNVVSYNGILGIYLSDGLALGNTVSRNTGHGIAGVSGADLPTVYGNNVLTGNNQGNAQAVNVASLHANFCYPGACP